MYQGYFFVATRDVRALDLAFSHMSFPVQVAGAGGRDCAPLSEEARAWFEASMDASHVLRNSVAVIEDGMLRVQSGPLVGQEERVVKVNRHHRRCQVRVCEADGGSFTELMPLAVPSRS